jgi:uncharacterized protein YjbJ (UPF0337 family)
MACARPRAAGRPASPVFHWHAMPTLITRKRQFMPIVQPAAWWQVVESSCTKRMARVLLARACAGALRQPINQPMETSMNWDRVEGNWKQFKGKVKEQWGKLTDDELDQIAGKRDQLTGKIQEQYGINKDEAERQVKDFEKRYNDWDPKKLS